MKKVKQPRKDVNQLAKSIVDQATGNVKIVKKKKPSKKKAAKK